ncbi:uncharacterized protein YALI1_D17842g [Yarrowia lipolytica]|uniref:Uncharacterized protein n=1 Tax=Yarrowia lipolytica TaxID=4952 RepID=A0A1D8NEK4_YARLL|nr:hypothetical protein YALI1_D17842g [Yarrowia lipolytica]
MGGSRLAANLLKRHREQACHDRQLFFPTAQDLGVLSLISRSCSCWMLSSEETNPALYATRMPRIATRGWPHRDADGSVAATAGIVTLSLALSVSEGLSLSRG